MSAAKVVARNTVTGIHQGEYRGLPPTGKSVTWGVVDVLSQMKQLGMIPAQRSPRSPAMSGAAATQACPETDGWLSSGSSLPPL
jgi:SnoaL-like polyketide cyclase